MSDLEVQADPKVGVAPYIPFRFEVSWRSLTPPPELPTRVEIAPPVVWKHEVPEPSQAEPAFSLLTSSSWAAAIASASIKQRIVAVAGALLVVSLAFAVVRTVSPLPEESLKAATEMGAAGWVSEWASDPKGSARGRQLSLYRPTVGLSNYSLEFTGRIARRSLGWVFRAADTRNYYVAKLEESRAGGRLALTRFAVVRGVEGPHIRVTFPVLASVGAVRIRLDARGSRFTIYVQDQVVDNWQEDRLTAGGVGFLNERDEQGQVESVRISVLKDGRGHE